MKKIGYLLVIFLMAGIISCEEIEDLNKDKFIFEANGEEIDYSDKSEFGTLENSTTKVIRGRKNDSVIFAILVPEFQEERFVSDVDDVSLIYLTEDDSYSSNQDSTKYNVEVTIDNYEEGTRIEGTFSGTIASFSKSDSIEIENGEFRINQ